jgi:glucose-6-phosphate-specific signal transduction histidine kinase
MIVEQRDARHGVVVSEGATTDTLSRGPGAREAVARIPRDWLRSVALALGYWAGWLLAYEVSEPAWYLPAGVRFAALWVLAPRRWPWLFVADVAAHATLHLHLDLYSNAMAFALATFAPWWSQALAIRVMRRGEIYAAPESPARMVATLGAMALAALLNAGVQSSAGLIEGITPVQQWGDTLTRRFIGNYIGMLVLAPLAFQFLPTRLAEEGRRRMLLELVLALLSSVAILTSLQSWNAQIADFASVVALAPMLYMAFRFGWRGAAWALSALSLGMHASHSWIDLPVSREAQQLFVALTGSIALTLGASLGSLRRMNAALGERNRQEKEINARLAAQAAELRDLSRRLVRAREDEQRRLAYELHDELGQTITALGAQVGLLARTSDSAGILAAIQAQRALVQDIQGSLRNVLQGLRPAVLDRFGLESALREGPIRSLLDSEGIAYELRLLGPVDRLGADAASAVYRICQEAATNCARHARAGRFVAQVDVASIWSGGLEVHLQLQDDGTGFDQDAVQDPLRNGLRGIRDRVLALAGEHRCESGVLGTRHTVWFIDRNPLPGTTPGLG